MQAGAPCRSQFIAHYNQLMRITDGERSVQGDILPGPEYAGLSFRNSDMKQIDLENSEKLEEDIEEDTT